jgi:hypothetical protein
MAPLCVKSLSLHSFALSQAPILPPPPPPPHCRKLYVPKYCTFVLLYCTLYSSNCGPLCAGAEPEFVNSLRSPGIDSTESIPPPYVAWRAGTSNRVVVYRLPTRQAGNRFMVYKLWIWTLGLDFLFTTQCTVHCTITNEIVF